MGTETLREAGTAPQAAERLNIWTCEVTGPRKSRRLHGYLLVSPDALFQETPPDNPYLRLVNEAAKREDSALGGKADDQG